MALTQWMFSFEHSGRDGEMLADRSVVSSQRRTVAKVRRDFLAARDADAAAHPEVTFGQLQIGSAPPGAPPADWQTTGDRATVLMYVKVAFSYASQQTGSYSDSLPWRAEARHQRDGWRAMERRNPAVVWPHRRGNLRLRPMRFVAASRTS